MFLAIEFFLVVVCLAVAFTRPELGDKWFTAAEQRLSGFARRRTLAIVSVGLLTLGIRLALLPILPIPHPEVTDEYSYLLSADTFAHGRLTNPTHPMWVHFETFQENWRPTYASMYYPGYGLFLAFGQVLLGHPYWGVWLSSGLMCTAICWALQGWMPAGWAFIGALLAVIRLATFSYWNDSYWGGTVIALGGALVLGAVPRIKNACRIRDSLLMGIGMALLLFTRPYEGLFFCLAILVVLVSWAAKETLPPKDSLLRIAMPWGVVMLAAFVVLGYYFWRVTGSPFTTPYQVNMRTYGLIYFPWDKLKVVPEFHHEFMRQFYTGASVVGWQVYTLHHPLKLQFLKALVIWLFYFGPLLTLPWLAWFLSREKGRFWETFTPELRFLLLLCFVTYFSCMLTIYIGQPHYVAALAVAFYTITTLMLRDLYHMRLGPSPGRFLARSIPLVAAVLFAARVAAPAVHLTPEPSWIRTWCSQDEQNLERVQILSRLEHTPGSHLVIVRYRPDHDFILHEWVFNNADIDGSKVIWARDMGPRNEELLHYFNTRHAWLVEPDYNPPKLNPYVQ